jgi:hypothetical protein
MKKRAISLILAVLLTVSLLTVPASAANAKDAYNYLKSIAMEGEYNSDSHWWYNRVKVDSSNELYYGIYYSEYSQNIELTLLYVDTLEITWRITSNPSQPYEAFIWVYDNQNTKGTVSLGSGYNGGAFSSFSSFSGNTSLKSNMLETISEFLPFVVEFTRGVLDVGGYTLADLGLTGYLSCMYLHTIRDSVTQQPTCGQDGVLSHTCYVCGYTETEAIPATGAHTWDNGVVQGVTCVSDGVRIYTCKTCGQQKFETVYATGIHTWNAGVVVTEPTCVDQGVLRYTCTVCNTATKDESIPALGHAWSLSEVLTEGDTPHACTGLYTCSRCQQTKEAPLCAAEVFTDMPEEGHWAHNAIDWAYFNGYTSGTSATTFSPDATLTRGQVVTFLYAFRGKPETEAENPFQDVSETDYYYKPVLWAVANGITRGMDETHFAPVDSCVRAQIVTFLWAAAGHPEPEGTENPFEDVTETDYFYKPVLWAVENGITRGVDATHFAPAQACTRAQMVTFLKAFSNCEAAE